MQRDYRLYLQDIIDYGKAVADAVDGVTRDDFLADPILRAAVERYIEIIGEAVKSLPAEVKDRYPAQWRQAARMRDVLIHNYPGIVPGIVWDTAVNDLPALVSQVEQALRDLGGQP